MGGGRYRGTGIAAGLILTCAAVLSAGCSSASSAATGGTATPAPVRSLSSTGINPITGNTVVLDEYAEGKTVSVTVGTTVKLLLHFTAWDINGSSRPSVLAQAGAPTQLPQTPPTCPPELDCAPVEATFMAVSPGTAVLSASRDTCGEAMNCPSAKRRFQVTVVVTR